MNFGYTEKSFWYNNIAPSHGFDVFIIYAQKFIFLRMWTLSTYRSYRKVWPFYYDYTVIAQATYVYRPMINIETLAGVCYTLVVINLCVKDVKISQLLSHIYRPSIHEYSMKKRFDQMSQSVLWGYLISSTVSYTYLCDTYSYILKWSGQPRNIWTEKDLLLISLHIRQRQRFPYIWLISLI